MALFDKTRKALKSAIRKSTISLKRRSLTTSFNRLKAFIIKSVKEHPVSRDLSSKAPSRFLGGVEDATLFNFMGFYAGSNPVQELIDFLEGAIQMEIIINEGADDLNQLVYMNLVLPTYSDMRNAGLTMDRYGDGRAWPELIEEGIGNLSQFLNEFRPSSVSGKGIQVVPQINPGATFEGQDYLTGIFNSVKDRINRYKINASINL